MEQEEVKEEQEVVKKVTYQCRVCLEDEVDRTLVLQPCRCSGTNAWIHERCLNNWREQSFETSRECPSCRTPYSYVRKAKKRTFQEHRAFAKRLMIEFVKLNCVTNLVVYFVFFIPIGYFISHYHEFVQTVHSNSWIVFGIICMLSLIGFTNRLDLFIGFFFAPSGSMLYISAFYGFKTLFISWSTDIMNFLVNSWKTSLQVQDLAKNE